MEQIEQFVVDYLSGLQRALELVSPQQVAAFIRRLVETYRSGGQVFIIGNGGSAAMASHMACDLSKTVFGSRTMDARRRFRVMALTDNTPLITAWANDVGYECVFAEQLRTWVGSGDLVIAITGSGNSLNIIEAVEVACTLGAHTFGLLGFDGGQIKDLVDEYVLVPVENYGYVEDIHLALDHIVTAYLHMVIGDE